MRLASTSRSRRNDPVYIGALFAFLMLTQRVSGPLMQMAQLVNQYDEARSAVGDRRQSLVNQPKEEGAGRSRRALRRSRVMSSSPTFGSNIKGATSPALDGVSFEVPIGATLGIVGRSGSGKTTVTRLLQRLHSDYEGLIKIDGVDVREYDVGHLRRSLGVVLQENFLFSGTIRENIIGRQAQRDLSTKWCGRRGWPAPRSSSIGLPRGYETHIYEGSPNLSGGQRQRLAIARALILDPQHPHSRRGDQRARSRQRGDRQRQHPPHRQRADGHRHFAPAVVAGEFRRDPRARPRQGRGDIGKHEELLETLRDLQRPVASAEPPLSSGKRDVVSLRGGARGSSDAPDAVRQFQSEVDAIRHASRAAQRARHHVRLCRGDRAGRAHPDLARVDRVFRALRERSYPSTRRS